MEETTLDELNLGVNTIFSMVENDPELLISSIESLVVFDHKLDRASTMVAIAGGRRLMALQAIKRMRRNEFAFYAESEIRALSNTRRQRWMRLAKHIDPEISPNLVHIPQRILLQLLTQCEGDENVEKFLERHGVNVNFKANDDKLGAVLAEESKRLLERLKFKTPEPKSLNYKKSKELSNKKITYWSMIPDSVDDADECAIEFEGVKLITQLLQWIEKHERLKKFKNSGFLTSAFWELYCELSDHIDAYNNKPTTKTEFRKILSKDAIYADLKH